MQFFCQFRFNSKADGEAETTAARKAVAAPGPALSAARTARAASANDAPVVSRSSTSTTRPPASSRRPPAATSSAPARFTWRCRAPSPAWSATARRCRSTASTMAAVPPRRSSAAAASAIRRAGSWPRAAVARRADGTGTRRRGPSSPGCPVPALTAPARAPPSAPASPSAPRSLWASSIARTAFSYGAAACTTGSPAGSGSGLTRRGTAASAAPHSSHSSVRGLPQPPQAAGRTSPAISRHHPRTVPLCRGREHGTTPVENVGGHPRTGTGNPYDRGFGPGTRVQPGYTGSARIRGFSPGRRARNRP